MLLCLFKNSLFSLICLLAVVSLPASTVYSTPKPSWPTDWRELPLQHPQVHWDSEYFLRKARTVLPRFKTFFQQACTHQSVVDSQAINWRLIAAMSFQESHWEPSARSHTGVRGMMMLTRQTARQLGVTNRVDVQQSIFGGARYLQSILDTLPEQIQGNNRLSMALASYNMGPGYVLAARNITRKQGEDPNDWDAVKKRLAYLGKSRANQALCFVRRTLRYYQLLTWLHAPEARYAEWETS